MLNETQTLTLDPIIVSESFETFIPWTQVQNFCVTVKQQIEATAKTFKVQYRPLVCSRVTQVYDNGACVYVYFGTLRVFTMIEYVPEGLRHDPRYELLWTTST